MGLRKDPKTGRKIALGAALAGVGGYLAGILTAPKSGKETRAEIGDKADVLKYDAELELQNLQEELGELLREAQSKTIALSAQAREQFNEATIRAKDAQAKAKLVAKAVKAGGAEDPQLNKAIKQAKQAKKNLGKFLKS